MRNKLLLSLFTLIIAVFFSSIAGADHLLDGLIGYWPLDESSGQTASDASGSNNVVTLVGDGATWDPTGGKIGGALQLDGTGSAAEDANGASYINGLNAFSVALWVKSTSVDSDRADIYQNSSAINVYQCFSVFSCPFVMKMLAENRQHLSLSCKFKLCLMKCFSHGTTDLLYQKVAHHFDA